MAESWIVSRLPGRLRLRHPSWRGAPALSALRDECLGWDGVLEAEANPASGSLLLRFDATRLPLAALEARLHDRLGPPPGAARVPDRARDGGMGRAGSGWADRLPQPSPQVNRVAKYGMLGSGALMLLALGVSTRLHAVAGGVYVALTLAHMLHHRRKLLR